jgi:PPE family
MSHPIPDPNFEGMSLLTKFQMMRSGPGGSAVTQTVGGLTRLKQALDESVSTTQSVLGDVGVQWQGQAASNFQGSLGKSGSWAQTTSQAPVHGSTNMQTYASSYDSTRNAIPNPAEAGPIGQALGAMTENQLAAGVPPGTFGPQIDMNAQIAKVRHMNQTADAALKAHVSLTKSMTTGIPAVQPPPPITTDSSPAAQPPTTTPGPGGQPPGGGSGQPPGGGSGQPPGGGSGRPPGGGSGDSSGGAGGKGAKAADGGGTSPSGYSPPPPPPKTDPSGGLGGLGSDLGGSGGSSDSGLGGGSALAPRDAPPPPMTIANGGTYGGGLGGRPIGASLNGGGADNRPIPQRVMGNPERNAATEGLSSNGAAANTRSGAGAGGMPPGMGGGMGGRGGQNREHRNNTYIPSDDPFRMKFTDVSPAVIGPDFQRYINGEYDEDDEYYR